MASQIHLTMSHGPCVNPSVEFPGAATECLSQKNFSKNESIFCYLK